MRMKFWKREKVMIMAILLNAFFLLVLYGRDHTLRHQAAFTLRRVLGYEEENKIYQKVILEKVKVSNFLKVSAR